MNSLVAALWLIRVGDFSLSEARPLLASLITAKDLEELKVYEQTTWKYQSHLAKMFTNEMYMLEWRVPLAAVAEAMTRITQYEITRLNNNGILRL